jgi:hypothetical protein
MDLFAYDNLQDGFYALTSDFNGFQELSKRKDATKEILKFYKSINPSASEYESDIGLLSFKLMAFEILLSQDQILKQFTESEKNEILSLCIQKYSVMKQNPDVYGLYSSVSQSLLIYRIERELKTLPSMKSKNDDSEIDSFILKGNIPSNKELIFESYDIAENHLSSIGYPLELSKPESDLESISSSITSSITALIGYVITPKGSKVKVWYSYSEPLTIEQINSSTFRIALNYPKTKILAYASGKYNCHSYAWLSQSTSNAFWMDDPSQYWKDGSYSEVYYCASNLIWTYVGSSGLIHSAKAISNTGFPLCSKWGSGPVVAHDYYDCPYSSSSSFKTYRSN